MTSLPDKAYWQALQDLLANARIVIDRPRGQPHPRYPGLLYPLDYGYLAGTTSGDGDGIDVWVGSGNRATLTGILCTFDIVKRDAEIKLLAGCSPQELETILRFHDKLAPHLYLPNPQE